MVLVPLAMAQKVVAPTQTEPSPVPSQPLKPMLSDRPKDQRDLQKPNTEERGTENVPLIVKYYPPSPRQSNERTTKSNWIGKRQN